MCDYSLHAVPNRLAVEGEALITHRFQTYTIGLASASEIESLSRPNREPDVSRSWWTSLKNWLNPPPPDTNVTAVCIPPGARLLVHQVPKYVRAEFDIGSQEVVTFDELSANAYEYRDIIRFRNGRSVLLQDLPERVRFEVLSLASMQTEVVAERKPEAPWSQFH
jgi:hypothetical protein